jgi:membrane glycosyltransferase
VATEDVDSAPAASDAAADSSHLRLRKNPVCVRAVRRVANYLRALGLSDRQRVRELSQQIAEAVTGAAPTADEEQLAERAVAEAQDRFEAWRQALYAGLPEGVDPLWLRAFIGARPELFLGELARAQKAAAGFGDPLAGKGPRRAHFRPQEFERARVPRWLAGVALPALLTFGAAHVLWRSLARDGSHGLELGWVGLFAFLFFLAATGFSTAVLGYAARPRRASRKSEHVDAGAAGIEGVEPALPRTALVMPIYHESAEDVFAALAGIRESLASLPGGEAFEIFVLSDSRDPEVCADEERAFRRVKASGERIPIYYHRRAHNDHQKAGNLAEFFESWGPRYEYAVVLDADSIMSAPTLVELVRRIDREPQLALLQAPLTLHRAETSFARALAFSSSVCGPVFTRGLSLWSGPYGNYYGHNAVIRVSAFLDCCALPKLKGEPPFGGHVLSHDFVEAALLCRAGHAVRIAHDLPGGSYEGLPPTLPEYVARDHRWCQGNMQHLRVAAMRGLKPMSRIHLLLGAFAYLAGPVWLAFMTVGVLLWQRMDPAFSSALGWVALGTALLLLGPWLLGLLETLGDPLRRRAHGGALRLIGSTLFGLVQGALLAPLLMLHHTRIVLSILSGRAVGWGAQQRRAAGSFGRVVQAEWLSSALGIGVAVASSFSATGLIWWLAPLWLPWSLAIPINLAVSSPALGRFVRRLGLLSIPSEREPEPLLGRIEELRALTRGDASARYRDLVLDPVLVAAHVARLAGKKPSQPPKRLRQLRERALRDGPASLSASEWRALAEDAKSMQILHRDAWRRWPVESWDLGRDEPQVPADTPAPAAASRRMLDALPASMPADLPAPDDTPVPADVTEDAEGEPAATPHARSRCAASSRGR